jgi:hypothetical protein
MRHAAGCPLPMGPMILSMALLRGLWIHGKALQCLPVCRSQCCVQCVQCVGGDLCLSIQGPSGALHCMCGTLFVGVMSSGGKGKGTMHLVPQWACIVCNRAAAAASEAAQ